jgi:hypothetical protein
MVPIRTLRGPSGLIPTATFFTDLVAGAIAGDTDRVVPEWRR